MNKVNKPLQGGCACGAVRYEATAEPLMTFNCHCRDCQRSSGGPFSSFVVVPSDSFKMVKGSLHYYGSPSEMGGMTRRGFCKECGAPVAGKPDAAPHIVAIRIASLDDPSWCKPQVDVWTVDAQPWDQMSSASSKFEKYPQG